MSRALVGLMIAATLVLVACAPIDPPPVRYALVYGVSRYDDAADEGVGRNLTYPNDDALAMASLLGGEGYTVTVRTDSQASKTAMEADVASLAELVRPRDLVLLYFAGHGGELRDFVADPSVAQAYPSDSQWIFPYGSVSASSVTVDDAFSDTELDALVGTLPVERRVVILDSCNSGGFIAPGPDVDAIPPKYALSTRLDPGFIFAEAVRAYLLLAPSVSGIDPSHALVLAAAGSGEFSWETPDLGHGVFTYFLMESATRGDLNGDGWVTAVEAYAYAASAVDLAWNQASFPLQPSFHFHPHISGGAMDVALFGS